ncbi:MAG TPA: insulinase family protein, partial [Kofleriaceae bacterium]|nr:insulinase family protein [Kofleriaceae bacterium]
MQYRLGLVIVVALGCGTLRKPPEPDRRLDVRTSGALFESNNGYRFAALPEPGASVVKVTVRYPVGSVDDPPGKEGLAHVVEHLLHEIEVERDGKKTSIDAELGRIAMSRNAVTSIDATSYETVVAPEQLGELVRLEVERLTVGCAGLTPAIFAREREVVLNELRQKQGANGAAVEQLIVDALYPPGHPYRRVDSVDSVAKLELADVCGFLVGPYRRGKVMVIASGAVDTAALQAAAGKHLARAPKRDLETPRAVPPLVAPQPGTVKLRADIEEPQLIVSWPLPPMASHEYRMLELAWPAIAWRLEIFGLMFQWGHGASTHVIGGAHAPVLVVGVTLRSAGDLEEAKSAAKKSAEHAFRVVHWPGDDRDSPRWRALWQASAETLLAAWESLDSRNELAANFMAYETGEKIVVGRVEELVKEHPKAVRDIVEGWLAPKRARFVLLEPSGAPTPVRGGGYAGGAE